MFDFNTGARRPVDSAARQKRLAAAQDLVQRTLAQHGLVPSGDTTGLLSQSGLMDLLHKTLPGGGEALRAGPSPDLGLPEGAQFLAASHQGKSGSRAYRIYVPASAKDGVT